MARYKLNDIAPIKQGVVSTEDKYWLLNLDMVESNTGRVIDYLYVSEEEIGASTVTFDTGNVLYSKLRPYLNKVVLPDRPGYATSEMLPMRPNTEIITREYLTYFLRSPRFVSYINEKTSGAKMPRANSSDLKAVEIECPPIAEQNRITTLFDEIVSVIQLRQQELQKLDDLIKARFVEMFGDAVDNPMGWEKKQLQEIVTDDCTISYGIVQTGDDQEEGIPVFRPVDIVNRIPKLEELKKTTEEISNKYKRTLLKGRELLITVRANIADTCIVGEEFKGCNVGRGIVPIRTQEDIMILEFLKYVLDSKHLNDDIKSKAKGITLIQLNMEDLREVELIIPPVEQQKLFVEFAKQVDKSKVVVQKALDKAQLLFDSLMQQYFG